MKHGLSRLAFRLATSILLLGTIAWAVEGAGLWRRLANADYSWFALAVVLGIVANLVSAWRWLFISHRLGLTVNARVLLTAYCRGVTLNTVLPGATLGGDAYRTIVLQKLGNPMLKAAASVALDRLSGLWALFVLSWFAWLALLLADDPVLDYYLLVLHVFGIAAGVALPFIARRLGQALPLSPRELPARLLLLLSETSRLAQVTFITSAVVQITTIAALWTALRAVTPEVPLLYLVACAGPVFLIAALPVSIGGYGTREAVLAGYWLLADLPGEVAVAGALLHGLAVTLQGALWSPLFLTKSTPHHDDHHH